MRADPPLTKAIAVLSLILALASTQSDSHAQTSDALRFFKNYFITGDYVVGGVGLRGLGGASGKPGIASGSIAISGVPARADIVAAFLYWQVVSSSKLGPDSGSTGATFEGNPLTTSGGPIGQVLSTAGTAPCWSSGGGTGSSSGQHLTYTYRADVLRFLPFDADGNIVVNGSHRVEVPDSGSSGNQVPVALGASLVVVFRDPTMPLKAVVLYDGGYTMNQSTQSMTQTVQGFYQSSPGAAKMTHIVGSAQANKSERLLVPGLAPIVNPFVGALGPSWDSPTFNVTIPAGSASTTTSVDHVGFSSFDCLTWGAVVLSTTVQDTDGDGLLDIWEESTATLYDPNNQPLPNLAAMGANKNHKDLFVEVGYMTAADGTMYGGVAKPAHSHLPTEAALDMMGDVFKNASVTNPDSLPGINVHFDVGNNYQSSPYVIPAPMARGGDQIDEAVTVCARGAGDPPWVCQFSDYPGTVGWKTGFKFLRDQLVNTPPPLNADGSDPCDQPGQDGPGGVCERRFDHNRKDMFRYALFAHGVGLPVAPCLNPDGTADDTCQATNSNFHVPRTNSGVADLPGGDAMVTLGSFDDISGKPVGTPFMQGSTLMHELGHTFELSHAGAPQIPQEPNCKPNYLSVMNYLFQLRGLFNDVDAGVPHMDYSAEVMNGINEAFPVDAPLFAQSGTARYRPGWYAPQSGATIGSAAKRFCNGTDFLNPAPAPMVRVDAPTVAGSLDWNLDPTSAPAQDLNFDGTIGQLNPGSNDWVNLHLQQLGSRRNVGGLFTDGAGNLILGPMSLDVGRGDIGRGDIGRGDIGRGDIGRGDIGRGDIGRGDIGRGDIGRGDIGRGDIGDPADEVDSAIAVAAGNTPPNQLKACVIGIGACTGGPFHRIRLDWTPPNVGTVLQYAVYRSRTDDATQTRTLAGQVPASLGTASYSFVDPTELPNANFTYFAVAQFTDADNTVSGPSNFVTILAVNDAPVANNDSYSTNAGAPLAVAASGVLANDADDDSPTLTATLVAGPSHGTLTLSANGAFTYVPAQGYTGPDAFTYAAHDVDPGRASNAATVSITVVGSGGGGGGGGSTTYTVSFSPLKSPAQQGSAVPINWKLFDASGKAVTALTTLLKMESVYNGAVPKSGCVASSVGTRETLYSMPNGSTGNSSFRSVSGGFQFNWDTTTTMTNPVVTAKGCYTVLVYLDDRPDLTNPRMTGPVQLK
ncbi:MAG TPA: Ig-like domain-containing protein [Vicinamibacterales bacterium]